MLGYIYLMATLFFFIFLIFFVLFIYRNKRLSQLVRDQNHELRLNESRLETLVNLGHMQKVSIQDITDYALEEAVKLTESTIGYIAFLNDDETVLTMNSWSKNAMEMCKIVDKPFVYQLDKIGLWGEAVRQRKAVITNDYNTPNPAKKGYPKGHIPIKRHMNTPIFEGDRIVAVAGVGNKEKLYNEGDVRQLTLLMDGMWKSIQKRRAEREIQKLKSYLSNILDSMPSIIIAVNQDCCITQWNQKAGDWTGKNIEDIKGEKISNVLPLLESYEDSIMNSISSHEVFFEHNIPLLVDNLKLIMDLTIFPLTSNGEEGAVIRIDDVTETHFLVEQINHSSKMDALGQLSGGVAHDFNNMLAGIMNAAELLKSSEFHSKEETLVYLDMILNASSRAADLTDKLLAFSRKGSSQHTELDLNLLIEETLTIISRTVSKKIIIKFEKKIDKSGIIGNYSDLQNVLLNLAINASHAMPDGGTITIITRQLFLDRIYCRTSLFNIQPGPYCEIEFIDSGTGIPGDVQEHIFEPFFSTKVPGKGTGLGLATTYGTIRDHQGAINVYSEPGKGTTFKILLPMIDISTVLYREPDLKLSGSGRILLVDDEQMILETGKKILEEMGYLVSTAVNGMDAVEIYGKNPHNFDVVILDMHMPEMDGIEAFKAIRLLNNDCCIILSSGYIRQDDLEGLEKAGLNGYIRKPYTRYDLSHVLNDVIH